MQHLAPATVALPTSWLAALPTLTTLPHTIRLSARPQTKQTATNDQAKQLRQRIASLISSGTSRAACSTLIDLDINIIHISSSGTSTLFQLRDTPQPRMRSMTAGLASVQGILGQAHPSSTSVPACQSLRKANVSTTPLHSARAHGNQLPAAPQTRPCTVPALRSLCRHGSTASQQALRHPTRSVQTQVPAL